MKFTDSTAINTTSVKKSISKRLLLTNETTEAMGVTKSNNPLFLKNSGITSSNPDIRYQAMFQNNALNTINFRNSLLLFAENAEIDKALRIYANEIVVSNIKDKKYPVYPTINQTLLSHDMKDLVDTMQKYLDEIFYPKLWRWYNFHEKNNLSKTIREFMTVGKLAYEIVYDNLKRPKDIVNIYPIDPSCLQKFRQDFQTYYVYKDLTNQTERILHESQVILVEYNEYDFGYISHVDKVRRSFNIMRGMQTAKIGWFAAKSQVRIHINMNMGDMSRDQAEQTIHNEKSQLMTSFEFDEVNGVMLFNGEPQALSYQEYITAETMNSGKAEIEEVIGNGPDLTEVDSLQFWQKYYWSDWEIPYDRVDPSSSETWSFSEPSTVKKSELNFSKGCLDIKFLINQIWLKPIITQFTLQEAEIGVDLSLLDTIEMNWVTFNEYEGPAELEMMSKRIELVQQMSTLGETEDAEGRSRKLLPVEFLLAKYMPETFTSETKEAMQFYTQLQDYRLGFIDKEGNPIVPVDDEDEELIDDEEDTGLENVFDEDPDFQDDTMEGIIASDDNEY